MPRDRILQKDLMKTVFKIVLPGLGIGCICLLAWLFGAQETLSALSGVRPGAVGVLFGLQLATLMASAWIWYALLNREASISYGTVFLINQAGGLVESLTPSVKFGGEAAKVFLFRQQTRQDYQDLAGILLLHKFLTLAPFTLLSIMLFIPALVYFDLPPAVPVSLFLMVAACVVLFRVCYSADPGRRASDIPASNDDHTASEVAGPGYNFIPVCVNRRFLRFMERVKAWTARSLAFLHQARLSAARLLPPGRSIKILAVSLAIWAFYPVKVYLACHFLGMEAPLLVIAMATLFAYVISMIPLLPGGLGTYEGTMALFFTIGGLSPAEGLAVSLLSRLVTFWFPLLLSAAASVILLSGGALHSRSGTAGRTIAPGVNETAEPIAK